MPHCIDPIRDQVFECEIHGTHTVLAGVGPTPIGREPISQFQAKRAPFGVSPGIGGIEEVVLHLDRWCVNASAARAFMRQASDTVRCYQPMTIVTDKGHSYAKAIEEMNYGNGPDDGIRHIDRKHLRNTSASN